MGDVEVNNHLTTKNFLSTSSHGCEDQKSKNFHIPTYKFINTNYQYLNKE
jgi:hypothetical protein